MTTQDGASDAAPKVLRDLYTSDRIEANAPGKPACAESPDLWLAPVLGAAKERGNRTRAIGGVMTAKG